MATTDGVCLDVHVQITSGSPNVLDHIGLSNVANYGHMGEQLLAVEGMCSDVGVHWLLLVVVAKLPIVVL